MAGKAKEESIEHRVERLRNYCDAIGREPSTVSLRALDNTKGYERLEQRLKRVRADLDRYENFMRQNPPASFV